MLRCKNAGRFRVVWQALALLCSSSRCSARGWRGGGRQKVVLAAGRARACGGAKGKEERLTGKQAKQRSKPKHQGSTMRRLWGVVRDERGEVWGETDRTAPMHACATAVPPLCYCRVCNSTPADPNATLGLTKEKPKRNRDREVVEVRKLLLRALGVALPGATNAKAREKARQCQLKSEKEGSKARQRLV